MELYVYDTSHGRIADFRPYLDGHDHSFDDHRALRAGDPRWEKIRGLRDPDFGDELSAVRFVGVASSDWHELTTFPVRWDADFEAVTWETR